MFYHHRPIHNIFLISLAIGATTIYCTEPSSSTWTGIDSSSMQWNTNWDNNVPYNSTAIFNGNGDNSPISKEMSLPFGEIEFTAETQVSIITGLEIGNSPGIFAAPGVVATFDIYEHQPEIFDAARMTISSGPAGRGSGTVEYNLQGYGQLYAYSGAEDDAMVNVNMTNGNNFFQVSNVGTNIFDNISSDDITDEIQILEGVNLTIRGTETNTIVGTISGEGSLTKAGNGTLILSNSNVFEGETLVNEGILILDGNLSGNLSVGPQGTLKGNGIIQGSLASSGTLSPGSSIGVLSVGDFLSTASSIYVCEISSSGESDQIFATGSAVIAGSLQVVPLDLSFTSSQTYNILHADQGITGTFSSITTIGSGLSSLSYGLNDICLTYVPFSALDLHGNAAAAYSCFTTLSSPDANAVSSELLSLPTSQMQQAFNQMQPSQFSAQTWTQLQNAILIRSNYSKHLTEFSNLPNCADSHSHVWIDGVGQWQHQAAKHSQFGYNDWTAGVSLGTDSSYKDFRFGGALSYTYSDLHWKQSAGSGQINSYYGGLYGGWTNQVAYIDFTTLGSYNQFKTSRHIDFANLDRHAKANHHGWEALAGLETGMYGKVKNFRIGPFGRFDYIYLYQNDYTESGAGSLNLHVDGRQDQLFQSQAGIVFTTRYGCDPERKSGTFTPRLELSYINQVPLTKSDYHTNFADSSCDFTVSGWNFLRNLGAVGLGATYLSSSEKVGISVQYDGQFGSKYWNQGGNLILDIKY